MAKEFNRPLSELDLAYNFLINVLEFQKQDAAKFCHRLRDVESLAVLDKWEDTLSSKKNRNPSCKSDENRSELRGKIFEELLTLERLDSDEDIELGVGGAMPQTAVAQDKVAYIMIGPPASGKSTIASKIADATGSFILDCDYAKRKFPEFDSENGSSVLHEESSLVTFGGDGVYSEEANLLEAVTFFEYNIVIPKIGADVDRIRFLRDGLIEEGYSVHLILVRLDRQEACRRAFFRFLETDRYVNLGLIFDVYSNEPILTYYRCMNDHQWASVSKVCTAELRDRGPQIIYTNLNNDSVLHQIVGGWHVQQ